MKLLRLEIQNFGALRDFRLDLSDGLNTLCRENGWGKSTLAVFLKAMLYGLPATRKADLDLNERRKYAPWGGGVYGGSLEFSGAKGRFRVERVFGTKEAKDEFRLFDLDTNSPSDAYGPDLGVQLFGIDADGFERSAYLSERSLDTKTENATVRAKLTGLIENPDDIGCYDEAQALIDRRRKYYEVKGGRGYLSDLDTELRDRTRRLEELREKQTEQAAAAASLRAAEEAAAAAEDALNRFHCAQLEAEKQASLRTQAAAMQTGLLQKERRRKELRQAFGGAVPTDEALRANRDLLTEYRSDQRALQAAALTEDEQRRLDALSRQFPKRIPAAADFDRAEELERELRDTNARLAGLSGQGATPEIRRLRQLGLPTEATLEQAEHALDRAEQLALAERAPHVTVTPRRRIPLWVPLSVLFCGVLLGVLALIPGLLPAPIPFGIAGGVLLLAALAALAHFLPGGPAKTAQRAEPRETSEAVLAPVYALLSRYGVHRAGGNVRDELVRLSVLCGQARAYDAGQKQADRQRAELTAKRDAAKSGLDGFFTAFGLPAPQDDPARALARLRSDADTLSALRRRADTLAARREVLNRKLNDEKTALQRFFAGLTVARAGNAPEDCQAQMEQLCMENRQLTIDLAALRQEADVFRRTHRAALEAPEKPVGSDAALRTALDAARQKAQTLRADWNRLADQTAEIPDLVTRIDCLRAESTAAHANFETLHRTADFLRTAKETLGTRYLGGMQAAFERNLQRLDASSGLHAVIDPQLSVSVRDGSMTRDLATASRGTRDLLNFSARLALTEVLSAGSEQPFLLLDDPFVNLDEVHLRAALAYLRALGREKQILYLVCHQSRATASGEERKRRS